MKAGRDLRGGGPQVPASQHRAQRGVGEHSLPGRPGELHRPAHGHVRQQPPARDRTLSSALLALALCLTVRAPRHIDHLSVSVRRGPRGVHRRYALLARYGWAGRSLLVLGPHARRGAHLHTTRFIRATRFTHTPHRTNFSLHPRKKFTIASATGSGTPHSLCALTPQVCTCRVCVCACVVARGSCLC